MSKKVAIIQSNYIPWKGYFDIINSVDEFILFDDMQYTRRDWRNRNKIVTPQGLQWLTVPVEVKGKYFQKISETMVSEQGWAETHWRTIKHNYAKAPFFRKYSGVFEEFYLGHKESSLSRINHALISRVCSILGITTKITWSSDYEVPEGKTERLVSLCKQANATEYLSGPAAKDYIVPELFASEGIALEWADYSGYREYPQQYGTFEHGVSIIDLIFNTGDEATSFMKSFK